MPVDEGFRGEVGNLNIPSPDPSLLTTQNLREGLENLKELIYSRLEAMDMATSLRLESYGKLPADVDARIAHLKEVVNEKFNAIEQQFKERDIRTEQAAIASKQALDAALLAAKELVGQQNTAIAEANAKSEASFTKQNDQTSVLISNSTQALTDRLQELKERIDRGEGQTSGTQDQRVESRAVTASALGVMAAVLAVATILLGIYAATRH